MVGISVPALMSIEVGKGSLAIRSNPCRRRRAAVLGAPFQSALPLYFLDDMIALMGASGYMAELTHDYLSVMLPFFCVVSSSLGHVVLVRNDTNPKLGTYAMSMELLSINWFGGYFFVLEFGWA